MLRSCEGREKHKKYTTTLRDITFCIIACSLKHQKHLRANSHQMRFHAGKKNVYSEVMQKSDRCYSVLCFVIHDSNGKLNCMNYILNAHFQFFSLLFSFFFSFCRKYMCKQWLLTAKLVSIQTSGTNATIANWSNGIQVAIYRLFTAVPSYSQSNNTIPVLFIVFCRVYSFLIFPIRKMNHNNIRLFVCKCVFSYSIINEIKIKCSNIVCYKWQNKKR